LGEIYKQVYHKPLKPNSLGLDTKINNFQGEEMELNVYIWGSHGKWHIISKECMETENVMLYNKDSGVLKLIKLRMIGWVLNFSHCLFLNISGTKSSQKWIPNQNLKSLA